MNLRIGARGSKLARTQAEGIGERLKRGDANLDISFEWITTSGDRDQNSSLQGMGGKGVFVKEIEEALLAKKIDLAVHSLKDVPQTLPAGLILGPFPQREDPRDAIVSRFGEQLQELPRGSTVGTSSPRRRAQILYAHRKRQYRIEPLRGNIDTRLQKLKDGKFDAIVMAYAGLKRLGLEGEVSQILETTEMFPAPGQGCLGLELRAGDRVTAEIIAPLRHEESDISARGERAFLQAIGGDCTIPLGLRYRVGRDDFEMEAVILDEEGTTRVQASQTGRRELPEEVGVLLGERILYEGGSGLLLKMPNPPSSAGA